MNYVVENNLIKFIDTSGISFKMWHDMLVRINYLGYGMPDEDSLKEYFDRGCFLQEDQSKVVLKYLGLIHSDNFINKEEAEKYTEKAKEIFGLTNQLDLAGYILTDGDMLYFSGDGITRDMDHRDIKAIYEDLDIGHEYNAAMNKFMNYGHIRKLNNGIDLMLKPTKDQRRLIQKMVSQTARNTDTFYVDISNTDGKVVKSFYYDFPLASKILNDIDKYFEELNLKI